MKAIYWVVIGGVVLIGLYFSGTLQKLIPSIGIPQRYVQPSQLPHMNIKQVAYMPPGKCYGIYGQCFDIPGQANV